MKEDLIIVKAQVSLLRTEDGGRQHCIRSGYRPNHFFENPASIPRASSYIGEVQFSSSEFLDPGETITGKVVFLKGGQIEKYITVGREWYINEGGRRVSIGKILAILPFDPLALSKK